MVAVNRFVQIIECVVSSVVQIDHHHFGAQFLQQLATETGYSTLVNDPRATLVQRLAQLSAQFGVIKQQGNRRCRASLMTRLQRTLL